MVRQLNGKTIIQAAPVRKAPFTAGELKNQDRFKKAVAYAKACRQNPEVWGIYLAEAKRRGGTSNAFAVAVSDFRKGLQLVKARLTSRPKTRKPEVKIWFTTFPDNAGTDQLIRIKNQEVRSSRFAINTIRNPAMSSIAPGFSAGY